MSAEMPTEDELRAWFSFTNLPGGSYPFVEDDNANVHGYGHQDKAEFASAVNRYDIEEGGVDEDDAAWTADDITHRWAVMDPDGEYIRVIIPAEPGDDDATPAPGRPRAQLHVAVGPETPGAFPITCLWGQR